jgi:hypothetical protein
MMRDRSDELWSRCMRSLIIAAIFGALALSTGEAAAAPISKAAQRSDEISAQSRRPPTRFRVYPGRRLLYRDCDFHLARQWRPSGTVIVPVQHCWWVRG